MALYPRHAQGAPIVRISKSASLDGPQGIPIEQFCIRLTCPVFLSHL